MPQANLKVYLDHLIPRDNLLYRRVVNQRNIEDEDKDSEKDQTTYESYLNIKDLATDSDEDESIADMLRKPDFQRATVAWTPEDCVDLLESVLNEWVVPSVILWLNPENLWYVLDGGHRISVLLAWIRDDWGDRLRTDEYRDKSLERSSHNAGAQVRKLLEQRRIGTYREYISASRRAKESRKLGRDPAIEMSSREIQYAHIVRRWRSTKMGFPILWVKGNHEKAEESFLKINKSGRQLSPWETKLVENRQSSFARAVMSIARIKEKEHCWPIDDPTVQQSAQSQEYIKNILQLVEELHQLLFHPMFEKPIARPQQPLLATPYTRPELQPAYLSEVLTITEGHRGQPRETRKLLQRDAREPVYVMIANGRKLLENAKDVITSLKGQSARSLSLASLVFFYNNDGTYVRSLFYGMMYWLHDGSDSDILIRKRLFSAYRGTFEKVLLEHKDRIIKRIGRQIGSGTEVTYPTAVYFNGLLKLLIVHDGNVSSEEFIVAHDNLIETLSTREEASNTAETISESRTFRGKLRTHVHVDRFLNMFQECPICGGRYYPGDATEIDHIIPHAQGGPTSPSNAQEAHPFCNNQRQYIEDIKSGKISPDLPLFEDERLLPVVDQHNFFEFLSFEELKKDIDSDKEVLFDEEDAEEDVDTVAHKEEDR